MTQEFHPNRYRPTGKQKAFLAASAAFVCYGGARGGGKSWALDFKCCCLAKAYPGLQILILRETQKDVKKNHLPELRRMAGDSARWSETDLCFYWKNGSVVQFGYCDTEDDLEHLQGQSYQIVCKIAQAMSLAIDLAAILFLPKSHKAAAETDAVGNAPAGNAPA